jgi:hypothetical protein
MILLVYQPTLLVVYHQLESPHLGPGVRVPSTGVATRFRIAVCRMGRRGRGRRVWEVFRAGSVVRSVIDT